MINIELYRRSGFHPCCDRHVDYKPCDCQKFAARCLQTNQETVVSFGDSPQEALNNLLEQISEPLKNL